MREQLDNPLDGRCAPPITQEAAREMLAALRHASSIRPDNWDEGSDPEQEAAWRAVDAAIAAAEGR